MQTHHVKCWPEYFRAVVDGRKTFEVRFNDRNYQVGDTLVLEEWRPSTRRYTGRRWQGTITYVMAGGAWGLAEGWVVLGIREVR